ncbi:MAG: ADP-ribosylglycohydrolase family protein [Treponema sp.]|jgi:ADP-ribosylglycohydrolase|nr:ADP-ribosylglycohydrolase family protein [Treponema sp.]
MYGAILGDILGSIYEFHNLKTDEPEKIDLLNPDCYYTDDTVLTVAVADAILSGGDYQAAVHGWARRFPRAGYGDSFARWICSDDPRPYNSWGNGSAMRVSPVGWAFDTIEETLEQAKRSAEITHNHPEGIKGAQATAAAIFLARTGASKEAIREFIVERFSQPGREDDGYTLHRTAAEIRPGYQFNESCQGTVPEAITAFLESRDFPHCMRLSISLGGDTDTLACIAGGVAEAFYGTDAIPRDMRDFAFNRLPRSMTEVVERFYGERMSLRGASGGIVKPDSD